MNTQIPLYRAKKMFIEDYITGYLVPQTLDTSRLFIINWFMPYTLIQDNGFVEIDPSTIAIHFPDMLASDSDRLLPNGEKDLRIFASLSDDGKGGDMAIHSDYDVNEYTFIFNKTLFEFGIKLTYINEQDGECWKYSPLSDESLELFEIIGVQK